MTQHEITKVNDLLDEKGNLNESGYAKRLLLNYSKDAIKANSFRIKEWDYYFITNNKIGICLTIDDNSYMALDSISFLNFEAKFQHTNSPIKLFTFGNRHLPSSSEIGDVKVGSKKYHIEFKNDGKKRVLSFYMKNFYLNKDIEGEIELLDFNKDSIVMATPFNKKKHFYYNQKINCLVASGKVIFDNQEYLFDPKDSLGVLDWGRGVWTYKNTWYWASLSGYINDKRFGFNLGYGFGDTSKASENILFYDGIGHKLSNVEFRIPYKDGKEYYLSKWSFVSDDGRLELDFMPILDRSAHAKLLFIESDQHQVFGHFSGSVVLDNGDILKVNNLLGFAEKVTNKW